MDPYPRGPDLMPITPKTGPLFLADSHANARARIMSAIVWAMCERSRRSGMQRAGGSATPKRRSAIDSSITPPSEESRPPSNAAVTFLPATAGNENSAIVSSVMAAVAGAKARKG